MERIMELPSLPEQTAAPHPATRSQAFAPRPGGGPRRCPFETAKLRGLAPAESAPPRQLDLRSPQ
eukprot:1928266-Pyramimonas_sp.AAC.1